MYINIMSGFAVATLFGVLIKIRSQRKGVTASLNTKVPSKSLEKEQRYESLSVLPTRQLEQKLESLENEKQEIMSAFVTTDRKRQKAAFKLLYQINEKTKEINQ